MTSSDFIFLLLLYGLVHADQKQIETISCLSNIKSEQHQSVWHEIVNYYYYLLENPHK